MDPFTEQHFRQYYHQRLLMEQWLEKQRPWILQLSKFGTTDAMQNRLWRMIQENNWNFDYFIKLLNLSPKQIRVLNPTVPEHALIQEISQFFNTRHLAEGLQHLRDVERYEMDAIAA